MSASDPLSILWLLVCTALVFVMQLGFLFIEAGAVRSKNAVNVATKNMADFCVSTLLFWGVGYAVMFGGPMMVSDTAPERIVFFLFQVMFCGTAATIVSGAVAERMSFRGYLIATVIIAGLIYPVTGGWVWGGTGHYRPQGWLAALGFADFAGSTVVHSVGGWVALAAVLVIGPRAGRFGKGGKPPAGANLALSTGGAVLLWIGWLGFNGGSVLAFDERIGLVMVNTLLAGAAGGLAGAALSTLRHGGHVDVMTTANGIIAGLVAITAAADIATPAASVASGAVGSILAVGGIALLERLRIDDAVGAIPAHLIAGVWGTLAVAFLVEGPFWNALAVQALGVLAIGAYAFGVAYALLLAVDRFVALRVPAKAEAAGLNLSEHGAGSALHALVAAMERQSASGDFSARISGETEDEDEPMRIALHYNRLLDRVESEIGAREGLARRLDAARRDAEAASQAKSDFLATVSHELRTPMNGVLGLSAVLAATPLDPKQAGIVRMLRRSGEQLVGLLCDMIDVAEASPDNLRLESIALSDLGAGIRRRNAEAAAAKGLAFSVECHNPHGDMRLGDRERIDKVVDHLVRNAIAFTDAGTVCVRVSVVAGDTLVIAVQDTGAGIAADDQPRLFEPFTQKDSSATRRHGGAGLGLAVVSRLVKVMGGDIALESRPDEGSTFIVRLPSAPAASAIAVG